LSDPYAPPAATLAESDPAALAPRPSRWRRFATVFASAFTAELGLVMLLAVLVRGRPEHIQWSMLLPLALGAAAITATAFLFVPIRRTAFAVLASVPAVVVAFFALGTTLDALGLI
jgi:uncharacterized membrane protein YwaF